MTTSAATDAGPSSRSSAGPGSPTSTRPRWPGRTYSSDASLYRVPPLAVVRPRDVDEVLATVAAARATGTPLTMRGAGTSIAGNAVGPGLVVDTSKHLRRVRHVDPEARDRRGGPRRRARRPAARRRPARPPLRPRPLDAHPLHDRRDDRQQRLRVAGARLRPHVRQRRRPRRRHRRRRAGHHRHRRPEQRPPPGSWSSSTPTSATVRTELGRFPGRCPATPSSTCCPRTAGGSTGSWSAARAPSRWSSAPPSGSSRDPAHRVLAVLGYPSMAEAADAVPGVLPHPLIACEGLDERIVEVVRTQRGSVPALPRGAGWLFAEVAGATEAEALAVAAAVAADAGALDAPGGHRPRRAGRAVADPRGRRRPRGPQPVPPGARRLGGRRGAAGAARRLPPRLRGAAARARPRRGALRPLRRRLRARAHRLRARATPAAGPVPVLRRGRGPPRRVVRRHPLRRARRRPGPLRAARRDVLARGARPVRPGQGDLRPRRPAQPRRAGRPEPGGRRPPAGRPAAPSRAAA